MSDATHGGKGDRARQVDKDKFDSNWDAIFGKVFKQELEAVDTVNKVASGLLKTLQPNPIENNQEDKD